MKDAILWKRLLNEGANWGLLEASGWMPPNAEAFYRQVITARIIVDTTQEFGRIPEKESRRAFDEFVGDAIAAPFESFFVEFQGSRDNLSRNAVYFLNSLPGGDGSFVACLFPFQSLDGRPVCALPPVLLELDHDRVVTGRVDVHRSMQPHGESPNDHLSVMFAQVMRLMSCKNVSLEPRQNDPKQVARAIKRHGGNADKYRYHVLVVRPPGAKSDAPAQEIGVMPRHVCRGHFAEYGPEFNKGLLFGRYAGRFYIPPHLKGKKENGIVEKDYAIGGAQ